MLWGSYSSFNFGVSTGTSSTSDEQQFMFGSNASSGTVYGPAIGNFTDWAYASFVNSFYVAGIQSGVTYARIRQASGSRHYEVSNNGITWQVIETVTNSDFISAPTHFYFRAGGQGTVTIFHLVEE